MDGFCWLTGPGLCGKLNFDLPIVEILVLAFVTGLVTWATVFFSVRASREATAKTIQSAEEQAAKALEAQSLLARETQEREAGQARQRLAESALRVLEHLQLTRDLEQTDPTRLEALASWSALQVQFEGSADPMAREIYELCDLTMLRADDPYRDLSEPGSFDLAAALIHANPTIGLKKHLLKWASNPGLLSGLSSSELPEMREWKRARDERHAVFMRDELPRILADLEARRSSPQEHGSAEDQDENHQDPRI